MFRHAITRTTPESPSRSAVNAVMALLSCGAGLADIRGSGFAESDRFLFSAGYAASSWRATASIRAFRAVVVNPGFTRPATTSAALARSARPLPLFLNRSVTTVSNIPSGRYTSADTSAIVPLNPSGVTPMMVKSIALMRMVLPMKPGSRFSCIQRA